jgi:spermidine synthase
MDERHPRPALFFATVLCIATAGIVYELVAGALASYVLGDSVTQFSLVIGVYLSALGLGAYLSKFVESRLGRVFVEVELATALAGGASAPVLFLAYANTAAFSVLLYAFVTLVGTLVGLELPLLIRILRRHLELKDLIAKALTFDYLGALIGSVLFSLVLVPRLGLVRTSLLFGLINALVALASTWLVLERTSGATVLRLRAVLVCAVLALGLSQAERMTRLSEEAMYNDEVVFSKQTAYQRITVTRSRAMFQLFLNGNLQFSSADEYRYHEALVHPAFAVTGGHARVLIAGGGDGLAAREVLRYSMVAHVTLVDLDPDMTRLARTLPELTALNERSLHDPRIHVVSEDAMTWLEREKGEFDVIIADFPDPNNFTLGKLYTTRFYKLARAHLNEDGAMVVQATSPLFARASFWCIARTIETAGFHVRPYHAPVPSFGEWGYVLAKRSSFEPPATLAREGQRDLLRWLDDATMPSLFVFGRDMSEVPVEINRLNNQALVQYYEREWQRWN